MARIRRLGFPLLMPQLIIVTNIFAMLYSEQDHTTIPEIESTYDVTNVLDDRTSIDEDALAQLCCSPTTPQSLPVVPQHSPGALFINSPSQDISEELIRTCVTPRKVRSVQETLNKVSERHICALKLLQFFFSKEELTNSNTDGSHNKECLDSTKLNTLKGG